MLALVSLAFLAFSSQEKSKISINGHISQRFDQQVSDQFVIEIDNSKSNYLAILFHSYPGPLSLTTHTNEGEFIKTLYITNQDSMSYFYLFSPTDNLITIEPNENELFSFSIFSSSIGCENDEDYFATSKPNQTIVFKKNADDDSPYKLNSKSSKCVLIDSGGIMELSIKLDDKLVQKYLNHPQKYASESTEKYSNPLFYTFITDDLDQKDTIEISYKSSSEYKHLYQTGDPSHKTSNDNKSAGVIRIDITVAIISGLFLVFILMTIIGLRRMKRMADAPSEDEGQSDDQLSVYEPESNVDIEAKVQYPNKISSDDDYSLSDEADLKVKDEAYLPPKDVYNMAFNTTELLEESDQNETGEYYSSSENEENPYNHDATTTL